MTVRFWIIALVFVAFGAYTAWALWEVGYIGLLMDTTSTIGSIPVGPLQVAIDLVIMAVIAMGWMIGDAKRKGLTPWPFVAITCVLGSIGPLLYLLYREIKG